MDGSDADIIVVGAGSAGSVIASRLTEQPGLRVRLVEAGGEPEDPRIADPSAWASLQGSAVDWAFTTVPQKHMAGRSHPCPRGKVIGGSSAIHAMGHVRGHPADIDAWADSGATGWTWQALLPYFARSETSPFAGEPGYGGSGPLTLTQPERPHPLSLAHRAAGVELGLAPIRDHNGPDLAGPTLNTLTIRNGRRQSVADAYLTPDVRARAGLEIVTGVTVDHLAFGEDGRVIGIDGLRDGESVGLRATRAVILAAGAIGTPSILLRSGIGCAADLGALGIGTRLHRPGVGKNLQDHLLAGGNVYSARTPVPPSETQHSESLTYIRRKRTRSGAAPELVVGICSLPILSDGLTGGPTPGEGYTLMFGVTHPRSRGAIMLASPDPHVAPLIDPNYLSAAEDRALSLEALDWARRLGHACAYNAWRGEEIYPRPEDLETRTTRLAFVERAAFTHHHPVGTCRMGTDAASVVCPQTLRVPGAPGLYVLDGSTLPSLTAGPVNAAIVAVAERGAEILRNGLASAS